MKLEGIFNGLLGSCVSKELWLGIVSAEMSKTYQTSTAKYLNTEKQKNYTKFLQFKNKSLEIFNKQGPEKSYRSVNYNQITSETFPISRNQTVQSSHITQPSTPPVMRNLNPPSMYTTEHNKLFHLRSIAFLID